MRRHPRAGAGNGETGRPGRIRIQLQVIVVTQPTRADAVEDSKDKAEEGTEPADDEVGDREEDVPAPDDGPGRDEDRFRAAVLGDGEVYREGWSDQEDGKRGKKQMYEEEEENQHLQSRMSTRYRPGDITAVSFRRASLLNEGKPAVRIHT